MALQSHLDMQGLHVPLLAVADPTGPFAGDIHNYHPQSRANDVDRLVALPVKKPGANNMFIEGVCAGGVMKADGLHLKLSWDGMEELEEVPFDTAVPMLKASDKRNLLDTLILQFRTAGDIHSHHPQAALADPLEVQSLAESNTSVSPLQAAVADPPGPSGNIHSYHPQAASADHPLEVQSLAVSNTSVNHQQLQVQSLAMNNISVYHQPAELLFDYCCGQAFKASERWTYIMHISVVCAIMFAFWFIPERFQTIFVVFVGVVTAVNSAHSEFKINGAFYWLERYIKKTQELADEDAGPGPAPPDAAAVSASAVAAANSGLAEDSMKRYYCVLITCTGVATFFTNGLSATRSLAMIWEQFFGRLKEPTSKLEQFSHILVSIPWFASWLYFAMCVLHTSRRPQDLSLVIGAVEKPGKLAKPQWHPLVPIMPSSLAWQTTLPEALSFFAPAAKWSSMPPMIINLIQIKADFQMGNQKWDYDKCWQQRYLYNALVLMNVFAYHAFFDYLMKTVQVLGFAMQMLGEKDDIWNLLYLLVVNLVLNLCMLGSEVEVVKKVMKLAKKTYLLTHMPDPDYFTEGVKHHLEASSIPKQQQQDQDEKTQQENVTECRSKLAAAIEEEAPIEMVAMLKGNLDDAKVKRNQVLTRAADQNVKDAVRKNKLALSPVQYFSSVCGQDAPKHEQSSEATSTHDVRCCWEKCHRMEGWKPMAETRVIDCLNERTQKRGRVMNFKGSLQAGAWENSKVIHELLPGRDDEQLHKERGGERRFVKDAVSVWTWEEVVVAEKNNKEQAKNTWERFRTEDKPANHNDRNVMCELHYNGSRFFLTAYNVFFQKTRAFFVIVSGGLFLVALSIMVAFASLCLARNNVTMIL